MERQVTPLWVSHRGFRQEAIENTIASFDAARTLGFSALETDLRLTKDRHLVLCHDVSFERLGGPKKAVYHMTRKELESLSLNQQNRVLFFDTFMARYKDCRWIFDIKPEEGEQTIQYFYEYLRQHNCHKTVIKKAWFLLWHKSHEKLLLDLLPEAVILEGERSCWRAGLSTLLGVPFLGNIRRNCYYAIPPQIKGIHCFKPSVVKAYHQRGAKVIAYLPSNEKEAEEAMRLGFDIILTDHKPILLED